MHAGYVVEQLRNPDPTRQHGDIGNKGDIAHQFFARVPRVATEHGQLSVIGSESKNRIERGRFAGAIRTDESQDATLFDPKIDIVKRYGCAENFAEPAFFYSRHNAICTVPWNCASMLHRVLCGSDETVAQFPLA